ncbi:MAG: helix-turn-helix transcriptional regulator [Synergistaceae bacterium]
MTTAEQIKVLCVRMDISLSELARRIGQSPQNFSAKLKRGTITDTELVKIADELNISYEQSFTLPNGEKITITNNGGKANG